MLKLCVRLVPPAGGKNWSFQTLNASAEQRAKILIAMQDEIVSRCRPFRQGDSVNWLMIEFWTACIGQIRVAANHLAVTIDAQLLQGDFTREEALGK